MASTRTFLQNASTRHAIFVSRFIGSQRKKILPFLERVRKATIARLRKKDVSTMSKARLKALLKDIDGKVAAIHDEMAKKITKNVTAFAEYEADFSARMFTTGTNTDFTTPSDVAIHAAVFDSPLLLTDDALTIESALRQFSKKKRGELVRTIKDGVIAGRTNNDIIQDINTVASVQRNHASALVTTITNHVSTAARGMTLEENDDLVKGYEWVSTLDGSTTSTCQSLDGRKFPKNATTRPPIHWGCRSTIIPIVKKKYSVLDKITKERPAVGAGGVETVKGNTTYNSWLKKQPKSFQDDVLGKAKGKLFREGGLPVKAFVDHNFEPLTLEQLKRKEPAAFDKAGLDEE